MKTNLIDSVQIFIIILIVGIVVYMYMDNSNGVCNLDPCKDTFVIGGGKAERKRQKELLKQERLIESELQRQKYIKEGILFQINKIINQGHKLILVYSVPEMGFDPTKLLYSDFKKKLIINITIDFFINLSYQFNDHFVYSGKTALNINFFICW